MTKFTKNHHYAIDAAEELDLCRERLNLTVAITTEAPKVLHDLDAALVSTERIIHSYLVKLIELERQDVLESSITDVLDNNNGAHSDFDSIPKSLKDSVDALRSVMMQKHSSAMDRNQHEIIPHGIHSRLGLSRPHQRSRAFSSVKESDSGSQPAGDGTNPVSAPKGRSVADSLLFRLVVALQLCQVRIDDAHFVIAGRRSGQLSLAKSKWTLVACVCCSAVAIGTWVSGKRINSKELRQNVPRVFLGVALYAFARRQFRHHWMADKVIKSVEELEEWRKQWTLVHEEDSQGSISIDAKSQRLIEYALKQSPKTSFWHSEGELRFLMVKRCMDLLYASVGTAVEVTNDHKDWQIPLAAMAATYYSFVGPNRKAHEAVSSAAAQSLIQNTWGMVSLPAIKLLSLKASRLLKGAALAERININGVPCFILSKDPCPDIIASLKRHERQERRRSSVSRLSTIDEREGAYPRHRRTSLSFTKRNVLLHLTGGGFFSHIIATDLPYLLDWSAKTGAIIICPEYALLPEAPFPTALNQVIEVYSSLLSGLATSLLGFEVDRVIVTGESAGGNLAAALCVNLSLERNNDVECIMAEGEAKCRSADFETERSDQLSTLRLPDALMLSCPALNMSLDVSHSRVVGIEDPVLPAGLIAAISDGYLPGGVNKKDPLASPLFAPDEALQHFPPTLLFASSDDPLLDDSIDFNKRLRCLGVESELKATHHVPHAFWGLGTAGFPEAVQVQIECEEFLVKHFDVRD